MKTIVLRWFEWYTTIYICGGNSSESNQTLMVAQKLDLTEKARTLISGVPSVLPSPAQILYNPKFRRRRLTLTTMPVCHPLFW